MAGILAEASRVVPLLEDSTIEKVFGLEKNVGASVKKQFLEYMAGRPSESYVRRCLSAVVGQVRAEKIDQEFSVEMARQKTLGSF